MAKDESMLSSVGLSKHFGGIHALEKLDIVVKKGQIEVTNV
jgi:ABC-type branched-subunit amino acid transport system ATPase component